jgi:hypothetical protein
MFTLDCRIRAASSTLKALLADNSPVHKELVSAGRIGGYYCSAQGADGFPKLIASIEKPNPEKLAKYFEYCQEKARRLAGHPEHFLSLESANDDEFKFPGAVRGIDEIDSFSGLPGRLDEVVSAKTLLARMQLTPDTLMERLHGNPYVPVLGAEWLTTLPMI